MKIKFDKVSRFFHDVAAEMRSVTWPTRADIQEGTIVVIVISGIVAIFLSFVDFSFSKLVNLIF